jgi:hypothetical protein
MDWDEIKKKNERNKKGNVNKFYQTMKQNASKRVENIYANIKSGKMYCVEDITKCTSLEDAEIVETYLQNKYLKIPIFIKCCNTGGDTYFDPPDPETYKVQIDLCSNNKIK